MAKHTRHEDSLKHQRNKWQEESMPIQEDSWNSDQATEDYAKNEPSLDNGTLWYVTEDYFDKFDDSVIMTISGNKAQMGKFEPHPVCVALEDNRNSNIVWVVPISNRLEKWHNIEEEWKAKNANGRCDSVCFGNVDFYDHKAKSTERAFIISNMIPVSKKYLKPYKRGGTTHYITKGVAQKINMHSERALTLYKKGIKFIRTQIDDLYKGMTNHDLEKFEPHQSKTTGKEKEDNPVKKQDQSVPSME